MIEQVHILTRAPVRLTRFLSINYVTGRSPQENHSQCVCHHKHPNKLYRHSGRGMRPLQHPSRCVRSAIFCSMSHVTGRNPRHHSQMRMSSRAPEASMTSNQDMYVVTVKNLRKRAELLITERSQCKLLPPRNSAHWHSFVVC